MTNHRTIQPDARKVIVGVGTHKHVHVAVAIDTWGIRLGDRSCAADSDGYQQLITWAERHGRVAAFGIEGTGSYGAGLARAVGPGWPIDRYPEDRGRGGRDDAPPQGRAPDGGQSPHLGDDHAEARSVVTAPPELRETLHPLADQALLNRCRGWRCGTIDTPTASAKHTLRALARRWFALSVEIVDHDRPPGSTHHPDLADAA